MRNDVCAVIVVYNSENKISEVVKSVITQVGKIVIIDNGSDKETLISLAELEKNPILEVIYNLDNRGIAGALNQGVRKALVNGYSWILTLDHDSIPDKHMVKILTDHSYLVRSQYPDVKIGILAPLPYDVNAKIKLKKIESKKDFVEVDMVISSGSLINIEVFDKGRVFNEKLFLYSVDDDFCARLRKADYKIFLVKRALLFHSEGKKEKRRILFKTAFYDNYQPSAYYYIFRNGIYMSKTYKSYFKIVFNRMIKDLLKIILFGDKKTKALQLSFIGIIDGVLGKYGRKNFGP